MSRHFLYKSFALLVFFVVLTICSYGFVVNGAKDQTIKTLENLGFIDPQIEQSQYQNGRAFHVNIALDNENLNTLAMASVPLPYISGLMGNKTDTTLLAKMDISGRFSPHSGLDISSWSLARMNMAALPALSIKDMKVTMATPLGGLLFQLSADIADYKDNNERDVLLKLSSKQYELKFNTVWEGVITRGGDWQYDITINDAGFNTEDAQASRISGNIKLAKQKQSLSPSIDGTLYMGMLSLAPLTFLNVELNLDSTKLNATQYTLTAEIAGYEDMEISMSDKIDDNNIRYIQANIETTNRDDLIAFMDKMREVKAWDNSRSSLSSLMLTEGNLKAIYRTLQNIRADSYILDISGTPLNLGGKIIALSKQNGEERRHVISIDPAHRAP